MQGLSPRELVAELDRFIVGQQRAKRAIAIAIRNRERRRALPPELARDVMPKNILMIGPTGVGKTEIARRVAEIIDAPFLKVEATKYTEAGYVGRDVESIVSDLAEVAVMREHDRRLKAVEDRARGLARDRIVGYLVRQARLGATTDKAQLALQIGSEQAGESSAPVIAAGPAPGRKRYRAAAPSRRRRELVIDLLAREALEDHIIEIEVAADPEAYGPVIELAPGMTPDELHEQFDEFVDQYRDHGMGGARRTRRVSVKEARRILEREEANKLIDYDAVVDDALDDVEESGIVFIDELDKLIGARSDGGSDVSGEGVQRDLLPIIEGSTVMTRYGAVRTDHVLFISAGSFFRNRPSELIPELQGRFPIRVDLEPLSREDLRRILVEPEHALPLQYQRLLETEGVRVEFASDGLDEMASVAYELNDRIENIGARRLEMVVERVMEDVSFHAPELQGQAIVIDRAYVAERLAEVARDSDLGKYIL